MKSTRRGSDSPVHRREKTPRFQIPSDRQVRDWVKIYQVEGEAGLEQKKKPGNPLSRYERRKELTYEEQLQYQIELLKRELIKKEADVLRLKKLNERKGGDARKS